MGGRAHPAGDGRLTAGAGRLPGWQAGPVAGPSLPRRRLPRAEREQLILDGEERSFSARGYHAASMDEIASDAGVTKPMLYSYFGSKHGLFVATIGRAGERLIEEMAETADVEDPEARVRATVVAFFTFAADHGATWTLALGSMERDVAEAVAAHRAGIIALVAAGLARVAGDLGLAPPTEEDATAMAHATIGAGERLALWVVDGGGELEAAEDLLTRLLLAGIRGG